MSTAAVDKENKEKSAVNSFFKKKKVNLDTDLRKNANPTKILNRQQQQPLNLRDSKLFLHQLHQIVQEGIHVYLYFF